MKSQTRLFLAFVVLISIGSCNQEENLHATETAFLNEIVMPVDLLISTSDMPGGWEGGPPYRSLDDICYINCAAIMFDANIEGQSRAIHRVAVLLTNEEAERIYNKYLKPKYGELPYEWNYESELADLYSFYCFAYEESDDTRCKWVGLYDNYVVEFHTWLIPNKMSLSDIEQIVEKIEILMSNIVE